MREGFWFGLHPYFNCNSFIVIWVFSQLGCKVTNNFGNIQILYNENENQNENETLRYETRSYETLRYETLRYENENQNQNENENETRSYETLRYGNVNGNVNLNGGQKGICCKLRVFTTRRGSRRDHGVRGSRHYWVLPFPHCR